MGNNFTLKTWLNSQLILKPHDQGVLDAYLSPETLENYDRKVNISQVMKNTNTLSVYIFYALL